MSEHSGTDRAAPEAARAGPASTGVTPAGRDVAVTLPCTADSAGEARRRVVDACRTWGCATLCDAAELIVAELVGNAVRHARTRIQLSVRRTPHGVLVEVHDDSPRLPERREPGLFDESGRGLWLVDAMAERWGVERELLGKRVWAELTRAG